MVSIEELLRRVQQAETETDRQWILLEMQMSQMPEALVSMLWASAIPHFFDAEVLAALRPELKESAADLYADLQALTFVETFSGKGYNIHELTREVLLKQLWAQDRAEFLALSQRAADYFFEVGASLEKKVEFCYHEVLNEKDAQKGRLLDQVVNWWTYNQLDYIRSTLQGFMEHDSKGRLDAFGRGFLLYLRGVLEIRSANYKEAGALFTHAQCAYSLVEIKNSRYTSTLLRDLSNSKRGCGDYKSAIHNCEQSLRISEERLGERHPDTATSLDNLASLYQIMGQYEKAEPLHLRALSVREEQLGENHLSTADSLNNLASLYQIMGQYEKAEPLHLRALSICEEQLGENHPHTASSLNNLAMLYKAMGQYEKAGPLHLRALSICEEQLGENHPRTASSLNNLASFYQVMGQYEEAEPLYLRALSICEEQLGERHHHTASSLNNLASLYKAMGQYEKAEPLYLRALSICGEQLGENHPHTEASLSNLVDLYKAMGRDQETISMLERWQQVQRDRRTTQNNLFVMRTAALGRLYEKRQDLSKAVSAYEEALSFCERLFGLRDQRTMILSGDLKRLKKRMSKKPKRRT